WKKKKKENVESPLSVFDISDVLKQFSAQTASLPSAPKERTRSPTSPCLSQEGSGASSCTKACGCPRSDLFTGQAVERHTLCESGFQNKDPHGPRPGTFENHRCSSGKNLCVYTHSCTYEPELSQPLPVATDALQTLCNPNQTD
uniref:Uncharacterized protein n=1 Tax=Apteryx owenii TaxID=8824 RepID=A0A8B9NYV3_APTOW